MSRCMRGYIVLFNAAVFRVLYVDLFVSTLERAQKSSSRLPRYFNIFAFSRLVIHQHTYGFIIFM